MNDLRRKTFSCGIISFVIYFIFYLFFDRSTDLWVHYNLAQTWIVDTGNLTSFFASGPLCLLAILFSVILVLVFDPERETPWATNLLFLSVSVAMAIFFGEITKVILARYRPIMLFTEHLYGFNWFSLEWDLNSTPSGHTFRAFSFFTALSIINKERRPLYIFLAVLVGLSRIAVTAHYPSDVIFGAYIGIFAALWTRQLFFPNLLPGLK